VILVQIAYKIPSVYMETLHFCRAYKSPLAAFRDINFLFEDDCELLSMTWSPWKSNRQTNLN
jgi:hypothetical protein